MMAGDAWRAFLKISRIFFSDSPTYFEKISGPFTARKFKPLSDANAFANNVLLQPGGPNNKTPFGGLIPSLSNLSGYYKRVR